MLKLVFSQPSVAKVGQKRLGYDNGYRMGVFDKANGNLPRRLDGIAKTKYNKGYRKGYLDGWVSTDVEVFDAI